MTDYTDLKARLRAYLPPLGELDGTAEVLGLPAILRDAIAAIEELEQRSAPSAVHDAYVQMCALLYPHQRNGETEIDALRRLVSAAPAAEPAAWVSLTDDDRYQAFAALPDALEGFLKKWGWLHFAKEIERRCMEKNNAAPQPAQADEAREKLRHIAREEECTCTDSSEDCRYCIAARALNECADIERDALAYLARTGGKEE